MKHLQALLVNPYIYDFAAYSFWSSPLGLLYIGSILRKNGIEISLIDCLGVVEEKRKDDGRAPFIKEKVDKPDPLRDIPKRLRRYGISKQTLGKELSKLQAPDLILITSIMTYWYPGTKEVLGLTREMFPGAKIAVGGIYPSLCYEHALSAMKGADLIVRNNEVRKFYNFIEGAFSTILSFTPGPYDFDALPYPCFDLYDHIPFVPLLTSYGCTYRCTYCATPYMHPKMVRRQPESAVDEILFWHNRHKVTKFVLYDDNFLFKSHRFAKPMLKTVSALPFSINIYNPNALNAALVDEESAHLLFTAGFKELRIGLEATNAATQSATGGKVDLETFERAMGFLVHAGFDPGSLGVYILAGLPFQKWEDVQSSIDYVAGTGAKAHIAEFTPIPHTHMFDAYHQSCRYPIAEEPLYQNNALFPFSWEGFTEKDLLFLKQYARTKNGEADQLPALGRPASVVPGAWDNGRALPDGYG